MSLNPDPSITASNPPAVETQMPPAPPKRPQSPWGPAILAIVSFGLGLFLMLFPWSELWNFNYLQQAVPGVQNLWDQDAFRGAFTGLGLVNIYISCLQIARLFRRS